MFLRIAFNKIQFCTKTKLIKYIFEVVLSRKANSNKTVKQLEKILLQQATKLQ